MKLKSFFFGSSLVCLILLPSVASAQQPQREPIFVPKSLGLKVGDKATLGAFSLIEFVVPPGTGPEGHRHSREDESFYILDGQLEFKIGERTIAAGPGSFLFAPRGIPHAFRNLGTTPARALVILSPPGLEKFFAERRALSKELATTDPGYAARSKQLNEKYGLEYRGDWSIQPRAGN